MPYPAADVEILDVKFDTPDDSPITQGSDVEVEVDIRNNRNEPSLGIVGVESPSSNNTILQTCKLLLPNSTDSIDESTADGTLNGVFSVLELPKEVTVTVGGYREVDYVGSCAGMNPKEFETDSETFDFKKDSETNTPDRNTFDSCGDVKNKYLDVLRKYDSNNNGSIEQNEFDEAFDDFFNGQITVSEAQAVEFALENNCSFPVIKPPNAVANANKGNGRAPLTVTFSGTQSSDPNNDIQSYEWIFDNGTQATGDTVTKTFTEADVGNVKAILEVTDSNGQTDVDSVSVAVLPPKSPNLTLSDATIKNVVASGNGKTATMTADVENNASVGIDVVVNITENGNQLAQETVSINANGTKNVQFSIDFDIPNNQQETKTLCVEKEGVKPQ